MATECPTSGSKPSSVSSPDDSTHTHKFSYRKTKQSLTECCSFHPIVLEKAAAPLLSRLPFEELIEAKRHRHQVFPSNVNLSNVYLLLPYHPHRGHVEEMAEPCPEETTTALCPYMSSAPPRCTDSVGFPGNKSQGQSTRKMAWFT